MSLNKKENIHSKYLQYQKCINNLTLKIFKHHKALKQKVSGLFSLYVIKL